MGVESAVGHGEGGQETDAEFYQEVLGKYYFGWEIDDKISGNDQELLKYHCGCLD